MFVSGDFAFNLYWQSVMLYLLFYYTEALHLPVAAAGTCYAAASVWDGVVSLLVGALADRWAARRGYERALIWGAVPLGLSFVAAYSAPPGQGWGGLALLMSGHLAFRTAYACVNIPYLALSVRIGADGRGHGVVASGRMLAGTLAAAVVAVGTLPMGHALSGASGPEAYRSAAMAFAVVATVILIAVGLFSPSTGPDPLSRPSGPLFAPLRRTLGNRALIRLCAAMAAMIVGVTMVDKAVLYYFKYRLGDQAAGQLALGWMMAMGGIAPPIWLIVSRKIGVERVWRYAVLACLLGLGLFIIGGVQSTLSLSLFLIVMQGFIVGLHFAVWTLLPDAIQSAENPAQGAGATTYGYVALFQRLAIGLGALLLGLEFKASGLHAGGGDLAFRLVMAAAPMGFLALSGFLMRSGRPAASD